MMEYKGCRMVPRKNVSLGKFCPDLNIIFDGSRSLELFLPMSLTFCFFFPFRLNENFFFFLSLGLEF